MEPNKISGTIPQASPKAKYQIAVVDWWVLIGVVSGILLRCTYLGLSTGSEQYLRVQKTEEAAKILENFHPTTISKTITSEFFTLNTLILVIFGAFLMPLAKSIWLFYSVPKQTRQKYFSVLTRLGDSIDNKIEFERVVKYLSFVGENQVPRDPSSTTAFNPNDNAIKSLYKINSLISFTNADPLEWSHPTFDYYLLNSYVLNLYHENKKASGKLEICQGANHKDDKYKLNQKTILKKLAEKTYNDLNFSNRFYFLSLNEIKQNAALISNLICGHELCGSNLFLVDSEKYNFVDNPKRNRNLSAFLTATGFREESAHQSYIKPNTIDFAVSIDGTPKSILYKKPEGFASLSFDTANIHEFNNLLADVCNNILNNNDFLFDIDNLMDSGILQQNTSRFHFSFAE